MTSSHPLPAPCQWFARLASALDRRSAPGLALLFLGAVLARGRRTVTAWIRAAGLSDQFRPCYTAVTAAGKKAETIAARLVLVVVKPLVSGVERLTLALDDTPTPRYGPQVQGAGVHHNPTPGPAGSPFVYGHVFVVLGLLVTHPAWGVIALPLLARMYVRKKDLPGIDPKHRPAFRTKLELAVELLRGAKPWLGLLGKPLWVVADGAYAKRELLKPAKALEVTVVSGCGATPRRGRCRRWCPWVSGAPAGHGSTAPSGSAWPSGPASAAGGRPKPSCCTGSGSSSGRAGGVAGVLLHRSVGLDARGARVRRARRHPDDRALLRAQGGGRRGGGAAHPHPRLGTHGPVSPSVAVLKFLAAERAGGERNGWIRWMSTYTTPKTGDRLPFDPKGERP